MFPFFGWNKNNFPLQLKINQKLLKIARQHKISPSTIIKNKYKNPQIEGGLRQGTKVFFFRGSCRGRVFFFGSYNIKNRGNWKGHDGVRQMEDDRGRRDNWVFLQGEGHRRVGNWDLIGGWWARDGEKWH